MQPRAWILTTALLLLATAGCVVAVNLIVDVYGLYRPVLGRHLAVYGDERIAKYLLNIRYVPGNFNAVLVGSSVSANWDMRKVKAFKTYNNSLEGANITEEKTILDVAMARPGISTVFLLVHPALTFTSDYKTVDLNPQLRRSALGSLSLWRVYMDIIKARLYHVEWFDYAGTETFEEIHTKMNPTMRLLWRPGESFDIDPAAIAAYRRLILDLRAKKVQLIFVVPPTGDSVLSKKRPAFDRYVRLIREAAATEDRWIDFTSDVYAGFRRDENFLDGSHLNKEAASEIVSHIDNIVNQWMARGQMTGARR